MCCEVNHVLRTKSPTRLSFSDFYRPIFAGLYRITLRTDDRIRMGGIGRVSFVLAMEVETSRGQPKVPLESHHFFRAGATHISC